MLSKDVSVLVSDMELDISRGVCHKEAFDYHVSANTFLKNANLATFKVGAHMFG